MSIEARGLDGLIRDVRKIKNGIPSKKNMEAISSTGITLIQARTQRGSDASGKRFKKYSKGYEKFRKKKGRSSKPDLTFTGKMLGSMQVTKSKKRKATIGFSRVEESNKAFWNTDNDRDFMGFTRKDESTLVGQLEDLIFKAIKGFRFQ